VSRARHAPTVTVTVLALFAALGLLAAPVAGAPAASAETVHRAGAPAPGGKASAPFRIVDIEAIKGLLRQGRGHVVLLHFWASWCGPCLEELPLIDKFAREMKPRGLEVLSLSLDDPNRAGTGTRVGALLQREAPNLTPNIAQFDDADALIAAIDPRWVGAIPALFVYDHHGQLRGNIIGEASRAELEQLVAGLLKAAAAPVAPALPPGKPGGN
jgi:thiol-disulfide isomerase/thioredoxin